MGAAVPEKSARGFVGVGNAPAHLRVAGNGGPGSLVKRRRRQVDGAGGGIVPEHRVKGVILIECTADLCVAGLGIDGSDRGVEKAGRMQIDKMVGRPKPEKRMLDDP